MIPPSPPLRAALDEESRAWLQSLQSTGVVREQALARLHALLLKASRFEVARRRASFPELAQGELDDIALQSADDALVAVLAKLDGFRGESRFTTWAYKFALLEAAVKLRRRPWRSREIPLEEQHWPRAQAADSDPAAAAESAELLAAIRTAIDTELSDHQREVLVAIALNGVPIDVLAERRATTRGALYKTLHDARAKLRAALEADGHSVQLTTRGTGR